MKNRMCLFVKTTTEALNFVLARDGTINMNEIMIEVEYIISVFEIKPVFQTLIGKQPIGVTDLITSFTIFPQKAMIKLAKNSKMGISG